MTADVTPAAAATTDRRQGRPASILIYGQQKTGTTGMYNTVKRALLPVAADYYFLFEPTRAAQIRSIRRNDRGTGILAKVIDHRVEESFPIDSFERRVMMFRDPRDTLISNLLFKPLIRSTVGLDMSLHERFLAALERKEADPSSVSVDELLELGKSIGYKHARGDHARKLRERIIEVARDHDFHLLSYENFVDGKLAATSDYLGLDLEVVSPEANTWLDHISRSRDYGAWRHWFTPSDVDHYRQEFSPFLAHFGYDDDWELADTQVIDPATSSQHVRASLAKRRAEVAEGSDDAGQQNQVPLYTQFTMADDGSIIAAVALARQLLDLDRGYLRSARRWANRAALQGSEEGRLLRDEIDQKLPRQRRMQQAAASDSAPGAGDNAAKPEPDAPSAPSAPPADERSSVGGVLKRLGTLRRSGKPT